MAEPNSATCPRCGAPLSADRAGGLCPKCLLEAGFESDPDRGTEPEGDAPEEVDYHSPTVVGSGFVPPSPEELDPLFPQLEILELLGKGGMGAVYKARQPSLDRLVAVKILPPGVASDPAFAERFTREAKALARLSHPNIVTVHDVGRAGELYFFVMEYVDGVNLREVIRRGDLTPEQALAIVPQICDALQYAHDEGIVHRDVKPENVLLDARGRVKIADFGLAKLLGVGPADVSLTGTAQVMGTLRYMAPEQVHGSRNVDHRADIYALGVVFYELLTGEVPMGRFAPPSQRVQVDVRLDEVVLRALESEPDKRYQRASELKADTEEVSSSAAERRGVPTREAETVSDAVVFRRLTFFIAFLWVVWSGVWIFDLVAYVREASWYFEDGWQRRLLNFGHTVTTIPLGILLVQWWYLLAKPPESRRGFEDFWRTFQSPDRRTLRYLLPAGLYVVAYSLAMAATMLWATDDVQAATLHLFLVAAPPVFVGSSVWVYGLPREPGKPRRQAADESGVGAAPGSRERHGRAETNSDTEEVSSSVSAPRAVPQRTPSRIDVPPGLGPEVVAVTAGFVTGALILTAAVALVPVAFVLESPRSGDFWAWIWGSLGGVVAGVGALVASWRAFGLLGDASNLLVAPDRTMFDRGATVYLWIGLLLLASPLGVIWFDYLDNHIQIGRESGAAIVFLLSCGALVVLEAIGFLRYRKLVRDARRVPEPPDDAGDHREGDFSSRTGEPLATEAGVLRVPGALSLVAGALLVTTGLVLPLAALLIFRQPGEPPPGMPIVAGIALSLAGIAAFVVAWRRARRRSKRSPLAAETLTTWDRAASCVLWSGFGIVAAAGVVMGATVNTRWESFGHTWSYAVTAAGLILAAQGVAYFAFRSAVDVRGPAGAPLLSKKAVLGAVLLPPFLVACGAVAIEKLTPARFGGVDPSVLILSPLAISACLLGGLAIRDIRAGRRWGLPLAVFDVLVLPLATVNAAVIFFALAAGGVVADAVVDPPELPPPAAADAPSRVRMDAANARLRVEQAHEDRVERMQKNVAGLIAVPLCALLNWLIVLRVWRSVAPPRTGAATDAEIRTDASASIDDPARRVRKPVDWWRSRPLWLRRGVRGTLLLAYAVCLVMFFTFRFSGRMVFAEGHEDESTYRGTIGEPVSWLVVERGPDGHSFSFRPLSPAMLLVVAACLVYAVHYRLRRVETNGTVSFWERPEVQAGLWSALAVLLVLAAQTPLFFP